MKIIKKIPTLNLILTLKTWHQIVSLLKSHLNFFFIFFHEITRAYSIKERFKKPENHTTKTCQKKN